VRTIPGLLLIFLSLDLAAQSRPAPRAFEVASIRPHTGPVPRIDISTTLDPGRKVPPALRRNSKPGAEPFVDIFGTWNFEPDRAEIRVQRIQYVIVLSAYRRRGNAKDRGAQ
jgi:hypothetical protein